MPFRSYRRTPAADLVLPYYVRVPHSLLSYVDRSKRWTERSIELSIRTPDPSLVEGVIYTLGERIHSYPALVSVIDDLKGRVPTIAMALERATLTRPSH